MKRTFSGSKVLGVGLGGALALAVACSDVPPTDPGPSSGAGTSSAMSGRGGGAGSGGSKAATGGTGATGTAGTSTSSGGSGGTGGTGATGVGGGAGTATATGGSAPGTGGGAPAGGMNGTAGSGQAGTGAALPVSCSGITAAGFELCSEGPDFCAAVFTGGEGCAEVCAAAGLECAEVWENDDETCDADRDRDELSCDSDSGHDSDYCLCRGGNGQPGTGGSTSAGGTAGTAGMNMGGRGGTSSSGGSGGSNGGTAGTTAGRGGTGGSNTGGTGNAPAIGPAPCACTTPAGEWGIVDATIVVGPGQVYDGECKIYRANPDTLGDGNQDEGQLPVFRVEDGGVLRNVVLGASAADGIHLYGDVRLENIHWLDIGEDAMTVKESGRVELDCGSATNGSDKVFQVNAASDIFISNFTASNAGKFMRQNGDTTFEVNVTIDHCDISSMDEVIFRTDSSSSHVTLTNTRYSDLGDGLFMFGDNVVNGNSSQSTVSNNQEY